MSHFPPATAQPPRQPEWHLLQHQLNFSFPLIRVGIGPLEAMIPLTVALVKALGWAQGLAVLSLGSSPPPISISTAAGCTLGPPSLLLLYRLACFAWGITLGLSQLARVGPFVLSFATVWNWWLLTLFFGAASLASFELVLLQPLRGRPAGRRRAADVAAGTRGAEAPAQAWESESASYSTGTSATESATEASSQAPASSSDSAPALAKAHAAPPVPAAAGTASWGDQQGLEPAGAAGTAERWGRRAGSAIASGRAALPEPEMQRQLVLATSSGRAEHGQQEEGFKLGRVVWAMYHVVGPMTAVIDCMTWLVLVPMLMATPDPKQREVWHRQHHNFESYNMHGFNAVMLLGELLLNRLPVDFFQSGWLALWASSYAVWSTIFYYVHGRFVYPFLDVHKPWAWLSYLGLYGVHWAAFLAFMALVRGKEWALQRLGNRKGAAAWQRAKGLASKVAR